MSKYGPARRLLLYIDVDDLILFLDKLNKDRAEGKGLPHRKLNYYKKDLIEFPGKVLTCLWCKKEKPASSKFFHKQIGRSPFGLNKVCSTCLNRRNKKLRYEKKKKNKILKE